MSGLRPLTIYRIEKLVVAKEFIGAVIGPGGKVIQEIQRETNTTISIEEVNNEGIIEISSSDKNGIEAAKNWIKGIVAIPEVGEVYEGKVKNIMDFGAFVEFMPGKDGLLHISEVTWERLESMKGALTEGDIIKVKLIEVDKKTGKYRLSRKVLLPKPENMPEKNVWFYENIPAMSVNTGLSLTPLIIEEVGNHARTRRKRSLDVRWNFQPKLDGFSCK